MLIAVTGGIGSGKSEVSQILKSRGATVLDADKINAELLTRSEYIEKIRKLFPTAVINGKVDKKKLGEIVFHDESARKQLNALAHPLILKEIDRRAKSCGGLIVVEIPLLTEVNDESAFDRIIAVTAPVSVRVARITERDGVSDEYARAVIRSQASDEAYCRIATDVIQNFGSVSDLEAKLDTLIDSWTKDK